MEEERPRVVGRLGHLRLDDARAELLEPLDVLLRGAVLGRRRAADRRRLRQQADGEPGEARLGNRRLREHRPHERDVLDACAPSGRRCRSVGQSGKTPSTGMRPQLGFSPTRSQHADGQADRAAGVGAEAEVAEARGERRRVAARRAARRASRVARVLHRPVPRVLARHAPRELVQVRLADDDGARAHEPLDRRCGARRHVVRVDLRAVRRADAGGVDQVLDEQALAVQRAGQRLARLDLRDDRVVVVAHGSSATASISIFAPGTASALTSTSVLAGRTSPKISCRTGLMRARSAMSVR